MQFSNAWAPKPASVDWAVAAAAGVVAETAERVLRLLGVTEGSTLFIDGGAGGVGAAATQIAKARGATVIASASEANQDYLREIARHPGGLRRRHGGPGAGVRWRTRSTLCSTRSARLRSRI